MKSSLLCIFITVCAFAQAKNCDEYIMAGGPVYIRNKHNDCYLAAPSKYGMKCTTPDLFDWAADAIDRFAWKISIDPNGASGHGSYANTIENVAGPEFVWNPQRHYLSSTSNGRVLDLWWEIQSWTGRQAWMLREEDGYCKIQSYGLDRSSNKPTFLSYEYGTSNAKLVHDVRDANEFWYFEDITEIEIVGRNPTARLGMCQGDCDNDGECQNGYKCFRRNTGGEIPKGCFIGAAVMKGYDVCVPKNGPYSFPGKRKLSSNQGGAPGAVVLESPFDDDGPFDVIDEPDHFVVEVDFTSKWVAALFVAVLALTVAVFVALCRRMADTKVAAYSKVDYVSETEA